MTLLAVGPIGHGARAAAKPTNLQLLAGARVGVLNLLDAEVTQFHAARHIQDSFLKTYGVGWPVNGMLLEALRERLTQLGLAPVPIATPAAIRHAREACLLNASLEKGLPKNCAPLFAQVAAAEHVDALIVLGPGLNDSAHADGTRRRDLPEYLRGWCFVSAEGGAVPALLNLSELLLVGVSASGADLAARVWGGNEQQPWTGFKAPADPKDMSAQQLAELQPLYALMLKQQAGSLLLHLQVVR
jgi:hypothetical protein